jgi:hypothetical protein
VHTGCSSRDRRHRPTPDRPPTEPLLLPDDPSQPQLVPPALPGGGARRIVLETNHPDASWARTLRSNAAAAWTEAERALGLTLEGTVRIVVLDNADAFQRHVGLRPTDLLAVAIDERTEIAIPLPAWSNNNEAEQFSTLVHEMVHLLLGRHAPAALPAWLNEGLAMQVAREDRLKHRLRLTSAGVFGGLIPLSELENMLLFGGERQALAYAQSHSVTRYLLNRDYEGRDDVDLAVRRLAAHLADPVRGPALVARLNEFLFRKALELQWRRQYQSIWSWISFLSGTSFIWLCTSVLFLLAYWRKRRMAQIIRQRFEDEEFDDQPPAALDHCLFEDDEDDEDDEPWRDS